MSDILKQFDENGFVLVKGGIPEDVLAGLREGLAPVLSARDTGGSNRPTRHQTILEPKFFHRSFVDFLDLRSINEVAETIIGTTDLQFAGLACQLGCSEHVICKWHRDFPDSDPEVAELLKRPNCFLQTNCAVYDDQSLWVIPGSHKRTTTPEEKEYAARFESLQFVGPIEEATAIESDVFAAMPGAINAKLQAGDCLLYNALLWHAAEYRPEWKRCTLHGGWKDASIVDEFKAMQWGLGHNPWLLKPDYMGELGEYFGPQLDRYQQAVRRLAPEVAA